MDRQPPPVADPLHWLVALCEQLVTAFEIVNRQGEPVLPALAGAVPARLRRCLLPHRALEMRALLDAASGAQPVVFGEVAGLRIGAIPLRPAVDEDLVLLVADRLGAGRRARRFSDIERVAGWLARAIHRAASRPADPSRDWHELYLLNRILAGAAAKGSDSSVMQALVDALAIWVDTDTRAYALTPAGHFAQEICLAGAVMGLAPRVIAPRELPELAGQTRLARADAERLGFALDLDVLIDIVEDEGATPWLLAHLGRFSTDDEARLALFSELLLPAVHAARGVEVSRVIWAMTQALAGDRFSAADAATAALGELARRLQATVSLTVRRTDGTRLIELTEHARATAGTTARTVLRLALALTPSCQGSVSFSRAEDRPLTMCEQRLAEAAVGVLTSWLSSAIGRGELGGPRDAHEPVDVPLDRRGRRQAGRRDDVSLLVIRPQATQSTSEVRDLWIGGIRRRLRPGDVAGTLPSGEIGVLLPKTGAIDAHVVVARLRRAFERDDSLYLLEEAPIGVATSRATASDVPTLLDQARAETGLDGGHMNGDASPLPS
jgi:hypothetical protein